MGLEALNDADVADDTVQSLDGMQYENVDIRSGYVAKI